MTALAGSDVTLVATTPADQEAVNELCLADRSRKGVVWDVLPSRYLTNVKITQGQGYFVVKDGRKIAYFMVRTDKGTSLVTVSDKRTLSEYRDSLPWEAVITRVVGDQSSATPQPRGVVCLTDSQETSTTCSQQWVQLRASMYRFGKEGTKYINQSMETNPAALEIHAALQKVESFLMTVKLSKTGKDTGFLFDGRHVLVNSALYEPGKECVNPVFKLYEHRYLSSPGNSEVAFSFGSRLPMFGTVGWLYDMCYYGNVSLDSLLAHICKHMEHAYQEPIKTNVFAKITLPDKFIDKYGKAKLQSFCGKIFKAHQNNVKVSFVQKEEMDLSQGQVVSKL